MKKRLSTLLCLLIVAVNTFAQTSFEIGGLEYTVITSYVTVSRCNVAGDVVIPTMVTFKNVEYPVLSVGRYAFHNCSSLMSIEIPSSVIDIEESAFSGCSSLTSIEIPSSVTSIGEWAFVDCSSLTSIEIPSSVIDIEESAFSGCSSLTSIEIPNSVTLIERSVFKNCYSLASINIPDGITSIREDTFAYCFSLASIKIPSSVTRIGKSAFYGCGLASIEIPSSVTSIGEEAFSYCSSLKRVTLYSLPEGIGSAGIPSSTTIYVPQTIYDEAVAKFPQNEVITIFQVPTEDTDIAQYDNVMYIEAQDVFVGRRVTIPVYLKNQADITGFSFDLELPEGMTVAKADNGKNMISLDGGRKDESHSISSNILENGTISVACLSVQSETFSGHDGVVVNITVDVAEDMAEGEYPVVLKNIVMGTPSTQKHKVDVVKTTFTVVDVLPGDVDGDGEITIVDAIGIVNYVIKANTSGLYEKAADADGDGEVTIVDAIWVVNQVIHLGSSSSSARRANGSNYDSALTLHDIALDGEAEFELPVYLAGYAANITAAQFALTLPEGVSLVSAATDADHIVAFQQQEASAGAMDQEYRFACLSLDSSTFATGDTVVKLRLRKDSNFTDGTVSLTDGMLATPSLAMIASPDAAAHLSGTLTGIAGISADAEDSSIYDLAGRKMRSPNAGVSIVNGKKRAIMNR